jgi:hypothetical protein
MEELFRFLLLRPANLPSPDQVKTLVPSFVRPDKALPEGKHRATEYVGSNSFVKSTFRQAEEKRLRDPDDVFIHAEERRQELRKKPKK